MFSTPRRRRIGWAILYVCGAVFVLGVVGTLAAVRDTQLEGTPTGQKLLTASERILDCTDPNGQCFKDSQERTAKAVGDINRVIVLAAACSAGLDPNLTVDQRQTQISECVIDRLALGAAKP
jgi:hypothetical protein